jgi:peptidoglycan/LPS O-acetylase OafA/YrhL
MSQFSLPKYIPALTGVRALAAYLVFISHYDYIFDGGFPHGVQRFLQEFHIGVTIFFVLSGFLIGYRYYNNFYLTGSWFRQYLKNRVARIYPMYFLLTTGAFIYYYFTHDARVASNNPGPITLFLLNITFLRGFFNDLKFTGIAQGWSLTVEECFYFAAPFAFFFNKRYKLFWLQPLLLTGAGALLVVAFSRLNWYGFFGNFTFMMVHTFLGRCFEFFAGIQLAVILLKKGGQRSGKSSATYTGFLFIFVCAALLSVLPIPQGWSAGLHHPAGIIINNYLLAVAIALFFYGLLTEQTLLKRILSLPFVELLGKSSYIFYLIHLGYIRDYLNDGLNWLNDRVFEWYDTKGLDWHSPFENDVVNLVLQFVLLNILSVVLFKFIEEPVNHYIRKSNFLIASKKG